MVIRLDDVYSIESDTYTYNLKRKRSKDSAKTSSYDVNYYPTLASALKAYANAALKEMDAESLAEWITNVKVVKNELEQKCIELAEKLKNARY